MREGLFHHAVGAGIAVMVGVAQQLVAAAQQAEIDAPGVDAHADDLAAQAGPGGPHPLPHVGPQPQQVPIHPAASFDRTVFEAVDLFQPQLAGRRTAPPRAAR